jgi:tripartite-type tricarboxylate transporter receptor subunit TctC
VETLRKFNGMVRLRDITVRCVCALALAFGALPIASSAFAADAYPSGPVRIIVPFPPGAITDAMGRILANELGKVIGQSVIVENGHTVLFQLSSLATNLYLVKQAGYSLSDFKPVAMLGQAAYVLIALKKYSALKDLITFGKTHPGELNCSGTGDGAATVIGSRLQQAAGINWALINYRGGAPAVQAVMTGEVHLSLPTQAAPLIYANPDKLSVLAITSSKRVEFLPDVPTFTELGYPIDEQTWFGLFVRSETPPAVLDKLKSSLAEVLRSSAILEQLRNLRISPYDGSLDDVPARLQRELADFTQEARKLGIEPQ